MSFDMQFIYGHSGFKISNYFYLEGCQLGDTGVDGRIGLGPSPGRVMSDYLIRLCYPAFQNEMF